MRKIVALLMIFAASFAAVHISAEFFRPKTDTVPEEQSSDAWADPLKQISPQASVLRRTRFSACGHIYSSADADGVIGLTRSELESRFPDWHIELYSERFVVMTRTVDGYCPDHYILFLEGSRLRIARTAEPDFKLLTVLRQDASPYEFDAATAEMLRSGMAFDSLARLEDFVGQHQKNRTK